MPRSSPVPDDLYRTPVRWGVLGLALLLFAALLYWSVRAVALYTTDLGGIEGNVVYGIQKLLLGLPLYEDPERPTFDVVQYTPLYYYLAAGIGHLSQVDPAQPQQVFILSRLVSLACNLATVWVVFRLIGRLGVARWLAAFWSMLVFATLTRHFYSRPDSLYLLLFALSMALFLRALARPVGRDHRRLLAGSTVVACLSILAKQSGVVALGTIGLYLLWQRRWKDLSAQVAIAAAVLGLAFGALCMRYGGHVLYQNIVTGLKNGFSTEIFRTVFLTRRYLTIIVFHVLGGVLAVRWMRGQDLVRKALGLAIVTTFVFALVTGLKSGSRLNYFLENFVLLFVALALLSTVPPPRMRLVPVLLLGYACLHFTLGVLRLRVVVRHIELQDGARQYAEAKALAGHLLSDRQLQPGTYVFINGRDFLEHFLVGYGVLDQKDIVSYSRSLLYDYSDFISAMEDGRVRFLVSRPPVERLRYFGHTFTGFVPIEGPPGYHLYKHRASP